MAEDTTNTGAEQQAPTHPPAGAQTTEQENRVPQTRLNEVIAERNAARDSLVQLQQQIDAMQADRLKEKEDYKKLYELSQKTLDDIKPQAEQMEAMRASIITMVNAEIERLPEDKRAMVPQFDDPRQTFDWLREHGPTLMRPSAPQMDAGAIGDTPPESAKLSPEQEQIVEFSGVSREEWLKYAGKADADGAAHINDFLMRRSAKETPTE